MFTKEELETWDQDNKRAENTHPRAFANGPFVRSLFRTSQYISGVAQQIVWLTKGIEKLNRNIEKTNESSNKLAKALNKITLAGVIIAGIGILTAIANLFK